MTNNWKYSQRNRKYLYIWNSETKTDKIEIPTADMELMTMASSKLSASNYVSDRQPEMAIWPPNRKCFYLWNYERYRRNSNEKSGVVKCRRLSNVDHDELSKNCQQVIAPKTENGSDKISAKTAIIPFRLSVVVAVAWTHYRRARRSLEL